MPKAMLAKEYYDFVKWYATPEPLRIPATQGELAGELLVNPHTLSGWKNLPNFKDDVDRELKNWSSDKNSTIALALYQSCILFKRAAEIKLWFELFGNMKKPEDELQNAGEVLSEEEQQEILDVFKNFGFIKKQNDGPKNKRVIIKPKPKTTSG